MEQKEFVDRVAHVVHRTYIFSEKLWKGMNKEHRLLLLEEALDEEKIRQKDILEYGLQLVSGNVRSTDIRRVLGKMIHEEQDDEERRIKSIQGNVVVSFQRDLGGDCLTVLMPVLRYNMDNEEQKALMNVLWGTEVLNDLFKYLWESPVFPIYDLFFTQEKLKTVERCDMAVCDNGLALEFVPEEFKTAELCRAAVEKDGRALKFVPKELKTAELCHAAMDEDFRALEFLPKRAKDSEIMQ